MPQKLKMHNTFGLCYENSSVQYPIQNAEIKIIMEYIHIGLCYENYTAQYPIQNAEIKIIMEYILAFVMRTVLPNTQYRMLK